MPGSCHSGRVFAGALLIVLAGATGARAQTADTAPSRPTQSLSANPFTLMALWFNADYEHQMTGNSTWGATAAHLSIDDFGYRNINATLKYYPRAAMDGFFIGARTGLYHVNGIGRSANFYGAGFELGYNWLLGRKENVVVSIGGGMTRLFGGDLPGASLLIPTVRLVNVGYRF